MKFGITSAMLLKKGLDYVPVYKKKKKSKTKIKSDKGKVNTDFHSDKMAKEGPHCIFYM